MADKNVLTNLYVSVITPKVLGRKVRPAYIDESFFSRQEATENGAKGHVMTRNQADKFLKKYNSSFETIKTIFYSPKAMP